MRICSRLISLLVIGFFLTSGPSAAQKVDHFRSGPYTLYYEIFGSGPPLYLFTGGPGEAPGQPYYQIIDSLKSKYTCVLLHQRGTGKSYAVPMNRKTVSIANYVADVEALRVHRGDKKLILLGISWGGLLAMSYAVAHPDAATNLVLLASAPPSYQHWNALFGNQFVRRSQTELDSMIMLEKIFSRRSLKELDSLKRVAPETKEVVAYRHFIRIHVRAMYYNRKGMYNDFNERFDNFNFQPIPFIDEEVLSGKMDITRALKRLKIPALILYGRQDDQGEAVFFEQGDALANNQMHVIEECGHELVHDQPAEFFQVLLTYLGVR